MDSKYVNAFDATPKSILIEKLCKHRLTGNVLPKDWYEPLVDYLTKEQLEPEDRLQFEKIMTAQKEELTHILSEISSRNNMDKHDRILNENVDNQFLFLAGKNLKDIVVISIIFVVSSALLTAAALSTKRHSEIQLFFSIQAICSVILIFLLLSKLNRAGENLQAASKKKN